MNEDIRNFARLGLVHHLLFLDRIEDPDYHVDTLLQLIQREDIETFDCCLPFDKARRNRLIPALKNCGKEVVACNHISLTGKIFPASTLASEQGHTRVVLRDQIEVADAIGATGFVFASGPGNPDVENDRSRQAFADFCRWLCHLLKSFDIDALLEPFDTSIDKKFLYGSTIECVELIHSLETEVNNLGINLDFAHIPLMFEDFSHAVAVTATFIKRVHLGNCVLKKTSSPWYGDKHPPIGFQDGEIDIPELTEQLRLLLETGYLNRENRGALVLEMQPFPGCSVDETVEDSMERLDKAWKMV